MALHKFFKWYNLSKPLSEQLSCIRYSEQFLTRSDLTSMISVIIIIIYPTEKDGRLCNYCIIQYFFTGEERPISLKPHKNAKTKQKGYVRTWEYNGKAEVFGWSTRIKCCISQTHRRKKEFGRTERTRWISQKYKTGFLPCKTPFICTTARKFIP